MNKLPRKIKTRWLNDLRSGKFKQGYGARLQHAGTIDNWNFQLKKVPKEVFDVLKGPATVKLARLCKTLFRELDLDVQSALIDLNDCEKKSFKQIANIIERHL